MTWPVTIAVVGLVAHPVFWEPSHDSFPLSSYTMFAEPRSRLETLPRAILDVPGQESRVLPPEAFGTDNVMQTVTLLWQAVNGGPDAAAELCRKLAVGARDIGADGATESGANVRVLLATFDVIEYFAGQAAPRQERTMASCPLTPMGPEPPP